MTGNMIQNIMIQIFTSFFYNEQYPTEVIENTLMVVNKNSPVFKNKKIKLENLRRKGGFSAYTKITKFVVFL